MNKVLLLVSSQQTGWQGNAVVPLLTEPECGTHAALCAAGLSVQVLSERVSELEEVVRGHDLVVMARPSESSFRAVVSAMSRTGGALLRMMDREDGGLRGPRVFRRVILEPAAVSLCLSRLPRRSRVQGWRRRLAFPQLSTLRPEVQDRVVGRWAQGGPALLLRELGLLKVWTSGFPLDLLSKKDLACLLDVLRERSGVDRGPLPAVPDGVSAVVILLHDVEEALPDDPQGLRSARGGIEGCLDIEARCGIRSTYNLVGSFAKQVPDLVMRMVAEGHEVASHSANHRELPNLGTESLLNEVEGAERHIGGITGKQVRGFRSPRSRWSEPLLDLLSERGYSWNAEADPSPYPYPVPRVRGGLLRIPVAVDDWDYIRSKASPAAVLNLWRREVLSAENRGCWVSIGSHPSVLGAQPGRMTAYRSFVEWLSSRKVRTMTLGDASAWWLARVPAAVGRQREVGS